MAADTGKCIGCRYCQYACPFGVPQFEWQKALGVVRKCTSCVDRLAQLNDSIPWGFWIGFDFSLIAFSAAGFTISWNG